MIKSSKLLIDLLVPWTNHFMVCSMVCSGVLSWIDFFKSYLMILLKKLRFLFVKININISNLIFLPPHPPRRFPVQKVVPWSLARVRASNPATNYMDRQGSIPGTLLLVLPSGWRLKAWVSVKKGNLSCWKDLPHIGSQHFLAEPPIWVLHSSTWADGSVDD